MVSKRSEMKMERLGTSCEQWYIPSLSCSTLAFYIIFLLLFYILLFCKMRTRLLRNSTQFCVSEEALSDAHGHPVMKRYKPLHVNIKLRYFIFKKPSHL